MLQPRILRSSQSISRYPLSRLIRQYATAIESKPSYPTSMLPPSSIPSTSSARFTLKEKVPELRTYKPITPGRRHLRRPNNPHLWRGRPYKPLTYPKKGHGKGGRNSSGRVTVRHRGGGHARRIRMVDFRRTEPGEHLVKRIEYDPNRSAHVALLANSETGVRSYVIAAVGMRAGDVVQSYIPGIPRSLMDEMGGKIDQGLLASRICVRGNCLPLRLVPPGTQVHNVGSHPRRGAVFCRSAGTYATVVGKDQSTREFRFMIVKLSSGEVRRVSKDACATIGVVSNPMWQFRQLGKAGRSRWLNIRPSVRGLAMNACDHPHGGGRGKSKGNRIPVSPWGQQAKSGFKTRKKRNINKWVVVAKPRNHGKRRNKK